jgi:hypothetical protein
MEANMEKTVIEINGRAIELAKATAENKPLLNALSTAYSNRRSIRVRLWYGDTQTGRSWNDEHDVMGYVSTSTGSKAIFILVHNRNSSGGGGILDNCIVRIDSITDKKILYKHPNFYTGLQQQSNAIYNVKSGTPELHAIFGNVPSATRFIDFMEGKRYSK